MSDEQAQALVDELQHVFREEYQGRRCTFQWVFVMLIDAETRWLTAHGLGKLSQEERSAAVLEALMAEHAIVS